MIQADRLAIRKVIEEAETVLAADPEMAPYIPTLLATCMAHPPRDPSSIPFPIIIPTM